MPVIDKISSLAKHALKAIPKPMTLKGNIHDDDSAEGNETVEMVNRLRGEARKIHGPIEREAVNAVHSYMGNQWQHQRYAGDTLDAQQGTTVFQTMISGADSEDELVKPVLNRTQNAILSNTEARTSRPVQIRFQPEETGEDAEYWLSRQGAKALMYLRAARIEELQQALVLQEENPQPAADPANPDAAPAPLLDEESAMAEIDQLYPDIESKYDPEHGLTSPISETQAKSIQALIEGGVMERDHLQPIDDEATADELQRVATALNRDANLDGKYLRAANYSTSCGYHFLRFTYLTRGARKHRISLEAMPIKSDWIDPHHDCIEDSDYAGEDRMVSLERAKVLFPELGDKLLEAAATNGSMQDTGVDPGVNSANYQRDMLQITTCWIRHHTVPVEVDRAIKEGWVEREFASVIEKGEDGRETKEPILNEDTGRPLTHYKLTKDGAEYVGGGAKEGEKVEPQDERDHGTHWPDAEGLRQVVTIQGIPEPVQDVRCPYWDIPLVLFINVPRLDGSPLGQGDAQRLEDIQREINRVAAIIINNQRYAQAPTMVFPQTVHDLLMEAGIGLFMDPGGRSVIPDHVFWNVIQNGGFEAMVVNPPELSQSSMDLLEMLLNEHDTLSGNVGVRQGRAPSSSSSGVAIAQLQEHATGTLALKARLDEHALTRYGRLLQHAIVSWLPETEWMRISSKYSLPALRRIIERAGNSDFNVQVSVAAGRGITKQLDKAQALEEWSLNLSSLEDTLEALDKDDPAGRAERIIKERGLAEGGGQPAAGGTSLDQHAPGPK